MFPFDFIACALCVITKKIIAKTHVKELCPYVFSSKSFMVSSFALKCLIHFEVIFVKAMIHNGHF